jgi:general secretion pathway protein D
VRALRGDGKTNILSTPSILTLDNQEAEIKVAQEVPFLTGSYTNTASSGQNGQVTNPFQTIESAIRAVIACASAPTATA